MYQTEEMPSFTTYQVDHNKCRYPHSVVWTPIPVLSWIFPFIGHMGICYMNGVIRDFAGPYYVSEDSMAFGTPARFWQLNVDNSKKELWDMGVHEASEIYKERMHNLCCDNCHSHVACALNHMKYEDKSSWNMVKLALLMFWHGKYVGVGGFVKTWLPFTILISTILILVLALHFSK